MRRTSRLQRDVAIKVLPPHLTHDASARERLRREALAAAALDHPFICKVFEIGDDDLACSSSWNIVGRRSTKPLRWEGLSTTEGLRIAGEIAEAIEAAHATADRPSRPEARECDADGSGPCQGDGLWPRQAAWPVDHAGASRVETRIDTIMSTRRRSPKSASASARQTTCRPNRFLDMCG